jgi:hypothetical protein
MHEATSTGPTLGVAMIGYAFTGAAHSQGWRKAHRFFDLPARPEMKVVCGRTESATSDAASRLGWQHRTTDWREVLERDDNDFVDIGTPGDTHREIALGPSPPASTCCVRSRWPTPWPKRTRWRRPPRKPRPRGSIAFDFESMNELHVYDATVDAADAGFRRLQVTEPDHPYTGSWWPPGHGLGYEHTFAHEIWTSSATSPRIARRRAVERSSKADAAWTAV